MPRPAVKEARRRKIGMPVVGVVAVLVIGVGLAVGIDLVRRAVWPPAPGPAAEIESWLLYPVMATWPGVPAWLPGYAIDWRTGAVTDIQFPMVGEPARGLKPAIGRIGVICLGNDAEGRDYLLLHGTPLTSEFRPTFPPVPFQPVHIVCVVRSQGRKSEVYPGMPFLWFHPNELWWKVERHIEVDMEVTGWKDFEGALATDQPLDREVHVGDYKFDTMPPAKRGELVDRLIALLKLRRR